MNNNPALVNQIVNQMEEIERLKSELLEANKLIDEQAKRLKELVASTKDKNNGNT